jgi:hypothetical protein
MLLGHILLGYANGHILRTSNASPLELHRYQFSGAAVQWLLATPDGRTVAAGHACGLVVVFDAATGLAQGSNTCELQSEYKTTPARTTGLMSADGRWLLACTQREENDVGVLLDLHQQHPPRRVVLPPSSRAYIPPKLQHSFMLLTPHHPTLLQSRIQSPVPLRQVQVQLVCAENMELTGHCYDRQIGTQIFQKDILPKQFNGISWCIYMSELPAAGSWLCTAILTASNDAGLVGHHLLPLDMPPE